MIRSLVVVAVCVVAGGCASADRRDADAGGLPDEAVIQYVRLASGMPPAEAEAVLREREPRFREVPGLVQKIYGRDPATGEICGIYLFESAAALEAFRRSELAKTIPQAYQAKSVRVERYDVLFTLWPGVRE
jgi:hypothetical protein